MAHVFVGLATVDRAESARLGQRVRAARLRDRSTSPATSWPRSTCATWSAAAARLARDERLYRFVFPERPGALMRFLSSMPAGWNISLFHYRNQGADYGRILVGMQVPAADEERFARISRHPGLPVRRRDRQPGLPPVPRADGRAQRKRALGQTRHCAAWLSGSGGLCGVGVTAQTPGAGSAIRRVHRRGQARALHGTGSRCERAGAPGPTGAGQEWATHRSSAPPARAARAARCALLAPGRSMRCAGPPTAAPGRCRACAPTAKALAGLPSTAISARPWPGSACTADRAAPSRRRSLKREGASGAAWADATRALRRAEQPRQVAAHRRPNWPTATA